MHVACSKWLPLRMFDSFLNRSIYIIVECCYKNLMAPLDHILLLLRIYIYIYIYIYNIYIIYIYILYIYIYIYTNTHTHTWTYTQENAISVIYYGIMVRVFANDPGDLVLIPGRVIPKIQKWYLMVPLISARHYKSRIKGKEEQSREKCSTHPYTL